MSNSGPKPILIWILILQVLFCIFIYYTCGCLRRRRQRHRHGFQSSTALEPSPVLYPVKRETMPRGLDPAMVESFPVIPCSALKGAESCVPGLECAVCLSSFREDQTLRFIPKCEHVFHPGCVDPWLLLHSTCPFCRADLGSGRGPDDPDSVVIVVVTENNDERYTLRLPDDVWQKIMGDGGSGRLAGEWCPPMSRRGGGDEETLSESESA